MFKKLLIASAVLAISSTTVFASGVPYVGAGIGIKTNTANSVNYRGVPGKFFAGYGAIITEGIYLAGELSGTVGAISITDNGLKSTYGYGLSVIPGVVISEHTMGFARLGVTRTRFTPTGAGSSTITGGQIGLGLQTSLMQNWDIRGEYTYTAYNSLKRTSGSPRSDEATLSLVYKFD